MIVLKLRLSESGRRLMLALLFVLSLTADAFSQSRIITGIVTASDTKEPLPGVSVAVKGVSRTVFTDVSGRYSIQAASNNVLVFNYIGFYAKEIQVGDKKEINTSLNVDVKALKEVVVVGYGEVAKSDLTGSVGQVNIGDLTQAPVMSFEQALAGRIAGVQVSSADGQPGSEGVNIIIRGAGSLTQDTSPLYVIDGFPYEEFDPSSLNMDDIEEMNILKDASATAIYGARGANGVVVIETKKGKVGAPVVQYSGSFGFQNVTKQMEMMDPYEFVKYQLERNNYSTAMKKIYTSKDFPETDTENYDPNGKTLEDYRNIRGINWQDLVFQNGATKIHNLSVRGGNTQTKYSVSGSLYDQEGVIIHSGSNRATARVTLDHTISKKFKSGVNLSYSHKKSFGQIAASNAGTAGHAYGYLMYSTWAFRPVTGREDIIYDEEGGDIIGGDVDEEFIDAEVDESLSSTLFAINPVKSLTNEDRGSKSMSLNANAFLTYDINKNLQFKTTAGYIKANGEGYNFYNSGTTRGSSTLPSNSRGVQSTLSLSETVTWNSTSTLTYRKKVGDHSYNVMAGIDFQERTTNRYGLGSQLIPNESIGLWGMDEGVPSSMTVATSNNTLNSLFTRINYNYKSKYLLTGTFRADGSSKFPVSNRWAYFPSGAFAWKMGSEDFMKNIKFISDAKLRISYGLTGNNRVSDYPYQDLMSGSSIAQSYSFGNGDPTKGIYPNSLPNEHLKWETTSQLDLGYDLALFKNRIEITADVYRKTTKDLLLNANIPTIFGFSRTYKNIGSLQNDGLELTLNTENIKTKNFTWTSSLNIGFNKNKILALTSDESRMLSAVTWDALHNGSYLYVAQVNQPAALFMGYIFDGVYQYDDFDLIGGKYQLKPNIADNGDVREDIQPGDIKYRDINGDLTVNEFDETIIGNPVPKHTGGFSNNFKYKGFSLNVFFQWSYGNEVFNANRIYFEGGRPQNSRNQFASYVNRWTPENPSNTMFRSGGQGPLGRYSSLYLEDASYIRLKTVSFSYSLPAKYLRKIYVKNLSITASAQNLFTITNYSGMDPEVSVRNSVLTPGFDWSAYPRAKIMVFGLKVTL
ncbi:TonB-dependent receptor plug [Pseudopedobacter saltans DSM 12145]|uniref:TonB-dependent receptor plug n=1 Tax=Pseudopedobacter saltans (strain ATCC 51119 / DSM 12145 / JCM 21818 / CCUG 39354 / LMG 10337 / NBRC 100064 / NCIMB 13643) TaxID=762903 RepID=F0S8K5_PSESL|nr:TonB-dependent receptor [Pseudopedobacter saltans]ADY51289.1 TonB-dependent receptor plug [Pseudopedobacter saltans DSM 12145]